MTSPAFFENNIVSALKQRRLEHAIQVTKAYCAAFPNSLKAWFMQADLLFNQKQMDDALQALAEAEIIDKDQPQVQLLKAKICLAKGMYGESISIAHALLSSEQALLTKDWQSLGRVFHLCNQYEQAHTCYLNIEKLAPDDLQNHYNLAASYRNKGDFVKANEHIDIVMNKSPRDWDCYLIKSEIAKTDENSALLTKIDAQITDQQDNFLAKTKLHFAKAKLLEKNKQFDDSFNTLTIANASRKALSTYQVKHDIEKLQQLRTVFDQQWFDDTSPSPVTDAPIFITSLPRSGSTLLERIISQAPKLTSAGELFQFSNAISAIVNSTESLTTSDGMNAVVQTDPLIIATDYLLNTKEMKPEDDNLIDKMPLNYLYLGIINRALPRAKTIHVTRSPIASCYAMYKTYFEQAYPFTYDLSDLADYYIEYRKLIAHWQALMGEQLVMLNYENLVTSPLKTCTTLFEQLAIPFEPEWLNLKGNESMTATASASQVRGEIYQSSIDLWKQYEKSLQPVIARLEAANINPYRW